MELATYLASGQTIVSNLLLTYYHKIGLSSEEFLLYLQLLNYQQQGKEFPDLREISQNMGLSSEEGFALVESLLNQRFIRLVTYQNSEGKTTDSYDLSPVFQLIEERIKAEKHQDQVTEERLKISQLYQLFEQEFARPLSPMEFETIQCWLEEDQYMPDLIVLALKEASLNQVYNFKYIDRILLNWERKNLRTKEQVIAEQKKRKKAIQTKEEPTGYAPKEGTPRAEVPLYNWLESD
ncbi:DnaD domain-containing protein [Vagococcus humatus]|uniref:DNA replication protein DnaD n=1 Tax=Vagococcus humatus TaxID=1889241 RepID=A0A3R9YKY8_9ENTE|nr:DnaD domain protein [Vagococcus humatus]RST90078.1 DNA replication protein DnaD [Vagococcus humatus]